MRVPVPSLVIHGMAGVLWGPGSQLLIHDIVGREQLQSAIRLNSTSRQLGILFGPAVGGGMISGNDPDRKLLDGLIDPDPLPAWLTAEDVAYYAEQFKRTGFRGPLNRYRCQDRDHALMPELSTKKIEQPALFIAGTRDPVLSFVPGVRLSDLMDPWYTDLRGKVLIEGAGHWVQQERPAEVNAALIPFLRSL